MRMGGRAPASGARSIGRSLTLVAWASVLLVLVLTVVAGVALDASSRAASTVEQLGRIQRRHQHIDMDHDAIHAEVHAGMLAAMSHDGQGLREASADLTDSVGHVRNELRLQRTDSLPREIAAELADASIRLDGYVDEALVLFDGLRPGASEPVGRLDSFNASFDVLEQRLARITDLLASESERVTDRARRARIVALVLIGAAGFAVSALVLVAMFRLRRSIRRSIDQVDALAERVAAGDLSTCPADAPNDEIGRLGHRFRAIADTLQRSADQARFGQEVAAAFDLVDSEHAVLSASAKAMAAASIDTPIELLLADSSESALRQAVVHPVHGGPGCAVQSPFGCAAVRRGATAVFTTGAALDACPLLTGRGPDTLAAVCVPVSFMGRSLGVLHAARTADRAFDTEEIHRLRSLGTAIGGRVGTVRAFERSELQASTDTLTGLMNRRMADHQLHSFQRQGIAYALALADVDQFKLLNDTYGHHTGDQALRLFAEALRRAVRGKDLVARWGGEEFLLAFPDASAEEASVICERLRESLADDCAAGNLPTFTASFGIADSAAAEQVADLVEAADSALYRAKRAGRNRTVVLASGTVDRTWPPPTPGESITCAPLATAG